MADALHDVIIAGAGPAGLHAAYCCSQLGLDVLVLEEHAETGRPCHCSGLISANLKSFVPIKRGFVKHRVRGAIMHAPDGRELRLEKQGTAAYVIDRVKFDKFLASRAKSGVPRSMVLFGSGIDGFSVKDDGVVVKSGSKKFEARVLLGCDGANSFVRKHMGVKPKEMLNGLIAIKKSKPDENKSEFVEMWFDKAVCDGFLWKIPRGDSVEYGMLGTAAKFSQLEKFFGLKGRYERRGGIVPLGTPKTYFNRVLLIGDAAAMIKPWSGGGVIYSLTAAEIAAKVIKQAKEADDFSEAFLKKYEQQWKKAIGRQISAGMLGRSVFKKMNNAQVSIALRSAGRLRLLMNKLDMDYLVK